MTVRNTGTLHGRYLVQNPLLLAWLRSTDAMLGLVRPRAKPAITGDVRELLLAVGGHLGDAVIATAMLAQAQRAFPGARIGVLTGSWNRHIFEGHPRVARVHVRDHWRHERRPRSWLGRVTAWLTTARRARSEVADQRYDAAIDLSPYWPNAAALLWRAGIPVRVGFTSGGRGTLYTHPVDWTPGRHATDDHLELLAQLAPAYEPAAPRYELPPPRGVAAGMPLPGGDYVVVHMGAGLPLKEWPLPSWVSVVRALDAAGIRVVLTGAGSRQAENARAVVSQAPAQNLCDALDWTAFRVLIAGARAVLTVDTVAGHLAAAAGTPCVVVMAVLDDARRWRPIGDRVAVLPWRVHSEAPEPPVPPAAVLEAASAFLPELARAATPRT